MENNNNVQVVEKKKWWKSKTVISNAVIVIGVLINIMAGNTFQLPPDVVAIIIAVLNLVLRVVTKTSIV